MDGGAFCCAKAMVVVKCCCNDGGRTCTVNSLFLRVFLSCPISVVGMPVLELLSDVTVIEPARLVLFPFADDFRCGSPSS